MRDIIKVEWDASNRDTGTVKDEWPGCEEDSVLYLDYSGSPLLSTAVKEFTLPPELGGSIVEREGKKGLIKTCPLCLKNNHCAYAETTGVYDGKKLMVVHCFSKSQFVWCFLH